jgi:hypothetical protein
MPARRRSEAKYFIAGATASTRQPIREAMTGGRPAGRPRSLSQV